MYCPKCNQSQASDDMRYCSRCGLPLATVAILLQNDGMLPPSTTKRRSSRARTATESGILTVGSWAMGLLCTLLFDFGGPYELIAKLGSLLFFLIGIIGLFGFVYAFLFMREDRESEHERHPRQVTGQIRQGLPTPQQMPLSDFPRRANTKEIVQPMSVTENTTRLLDDSDAQVSR